MKTLGMIATLVLCFHFSYAQSSFEEIKKHSSKDSIARFVPKPSKDIETLFSGQNSFGAYLSFTIGYTEVDNNAALQSGGRLMLVANHYLGIGFGGKGFVSSPQEVSYTGILPDTQRYKSITGGYGGLYLEPVLYSTKPIHLAFPVLLGAGMMGESTWTNNFNSQETTSSASSIFFVVEPGVELEFNITKWFRIGLGAAYRITSDVEGLTEIAAESQNSLNYGMTFKMGLF